MGHPEQLAFVELASIGVEGQKGMTAIEIGSYDVNGNTRSKFDSSIKWIGVDLVSGPGVDVVNFGHLIEFPDNSFDISISCECFEHDEFWLKTFENMIRMTKIGGVIIFTCASMGRPEHGTSRSLAYLSPGTQSKGLDYYRNLNSSDFEKNIEMKKAFSQYTFFYNPVTFDLYFVGQKKGGVQKHISLPKKSELINIKKITPMFHKIARTPLYLLLKILPIDKYNNFAFRYWKFLVKIESVVFRGKNIRLENR